MAKQLNNYANLTYNYGTNSGASVSNIATTNLLDSYNLTATKQSHNSNWRPSENLTYIVNITNSGTEPIYAISIQDDLGGTPNLLNYLDGSLRLTINGAVTTLTPTSTSPLTAVLPNPLTSGETAIITYVATVVGDISAEITEITNTVTVAGHETSDTGTVITVTPSPTLTLPIANYASVTINKMVDKTNIATGEQLTYTITLENSGNTEATGVRIRDQLPAEFTITSVRSTTGGVVTTFDPTDYSVTGNLLILPTSAVKTISVPASTTAGPGITTVTIVGTVAI